MKPLIDRTRAWLASWLVHLAIWVHPGPKTRIGNRVTLTTLVKKKAPVEGGLKGWDEK